MSYNMKRKLRLHIKSLRSKWKRHRGKPKSDNLRSLGKLGSNTKKCLDKKSSFSDIFR